MKLHQKQETTEKTGEIELQEEQKTLEYNMKQRRNSTGKKENNKRARKLQEKVECYMKTGNY